MFSMSEFRQENDSGLYRQLSDRWDGPVLLSLAGSDVGFFCCPLGTRVSSGRAARPPLPSAFPMALSRFETLCFSIFLVFLFASLEYLGRLLLLLPLAEVMISPRCFWCDRVSVKAYGLPKLAGLKGGIRPSARGCHIGAVGRVIIGIPASVPCGVGDLP